MINIRLEAYKVIQKVLLKNTFSGQLLFQTSKKIKKTGQKPELLYMLVKGVIKMQANLDFIASQFTEPKKYSTTNKKIKILIYLGLFQLIYCDSISEYAAVNETVALAKKLYGDKIGKFVNAILREFLRSDKIEYPAEISQRLASQFSFPKQIIDSWLEYWTAEEVENLCSYFNEVPKLHMRINTLATEKQKIIEYFRRRDLDLYETKASENILVTTHGQGILNDVAFSEGYYSVQDTSAAMVVELLQPEQDESILDLFAGPGGKVTYIAELMKNSGEIIAVDKFPRKTKRIKQAAERLKISNMNIITEDAFKYGPVAPAFDKVLLDVPCTGSGVFQKKAELRWQLNQNLNELLKIQENALKLGASFVKDEGYLVYSTCSINKKENERQVENFLLRHKNFKLISASDFIPAEYVENGFLRTIPFKHRMDGAFAAKMKKVEK